MVGTERMGERQQQRNRTDEEIPRGLVLTPRGRQYSTVRSPFQLPHGAAVSIHDLIGSDQFIKSTQKN